MKEHGGNTIGLCPCVWSRLSDKGACLVWMFALGMACIWIADPRGAGDKPYDAAWQELAVDVSLLVALLMLLPRKVALWVKRMVYVLAYGVALVDIFCLEKFESTLTPTMLLLLGETNSSEAGEFLSSYVTADVLFSEVGWILLLLLLHATWAIVRRVFLKRQKRGNGYQTDTKNNFAKATGPVSGKSRSNGAWVGWCIAVLWAAIMVWCAISSWDNKAAYSRLMSCDNIGDVEHELTEKKRVVMYLPVYRLAFSIRANQLASRQVSQLSAVCEEVEKNKGTGNGSLINGCDYLSPNIVLIIGESFNRHHAQLYGSEKENTPRQVARAQKDELVAYSDVVAPWNLTSYVFKHIFSLYSVGDKGEWCDYPLFPQLFRKAGYHVTFLTNQFLPQAKEAVYDFSGGFFLNNPKLSQWMFDTRNTRLYYFDEGLLDEYDRLKSEETAHNLTIFHLKGMHVDYRTRCPKSKMKFTRDDYSRPGFNERERQVMAYYDNAILYNDSIVDQIIHRFEDRDAVVIYVPDHGEEVYEGSVHFFGRMHSTEITARLAHAEFDIPFWIYCSPTYREKHPEVWQKIVASKDRRYMTDALPHMLLYLAGIHTELYKESQNVLDDHYDEHRPRVLKHEVDYDVVLNHAKMKQL